MQVRKCDDQYERPSVLKIESLCVAIKCNYFYGLVLVIHELNGGDYHTQLQSYFRKGLFLLNRKLMGVTITRGYSFTASERTVNE